MNAKQGAQLDWLQDVDHFFDNYAHCFPRVAGSSLRARLFEVTEELESLSFHQNCSTPDRSITVWYQRARHALEFDLMVPLVAIARLVVDDMQLDTFRRPRGRTGAEALVKVARAMAMAAQPYEAAFIEAGMPADFRAQMHDRCDEIVANRAERDRARSDASQTTMVMAELLSEGRMVVHCLDGLVRAEMAHTPNLRGVWSDVRRPPASGRRVAA